MTNSRHLVNQGNTDEEERYGVDPHYGVEPAYAGDADGYDGEQLDLADRQSLRRVAGLSTELQDVTEVEYRQLRLERVVLVGVWNSGTAADAEASLRELAALAETAGSEVLDGVVHEVISYVWIAKKTGRAIDHIRPRKDTRMPKEPIQFGVRRFLRPVIADWEVRP